VYYYLFQFVKDWNFYEFLGNLRAKENIEIIFAGALLIHVKKSILIVTVLNGINMKLKFLYIYTECDPCFL